MSVEQVVKGIVDAAVRAPGAKDMHAFVVVGLRVNEDGSMDLAAQSAFRACVTVPAEGRKRLSPQVCHAVKAWLGSELQQMRSEKREGNA